MAHGGKRKNSGRKEKYTCEMKNKTFYIPILAEDEITESVRSISDKYKKTK